MFRHQRQNCFAARSRARDDWRSPFSSNWSCQAIFIFETAQCSQDGLSLFYIIQDGLSLLFRYFSDLKGFREMRKIDILLTTFRTFKTLIECIVHWEWPSDKTIQDFLQKTSAWKCNIVSHITKTGRTQYLQFCNDLRWLSIFQTIHEYS